MEPDGGLVRRAERSGRRSRYGNDAVNRLRGIGEDVVCNRRPRGLAVGARGAEVNAAKDAGILDFAEGRGKIRKRDRKSVV